MTALTRTAFGVVVMTLIAAALGGWFGVRYGMREAQRSAPTLDAVVHRRLDLTAEQRRQIASLEAAFGVRQRALEGEMRAADHDLAQAIISDRQYGPREQQAIDRFHSAMKALQQETVMHVLAMRAVLTPQQARQFDQAVTQVLESAQP